MENQGPSLKNQWKNEVRDWKSMGIQSSSSKKTLKIIAPIWKKIGKAKSTFENQWKIKVQDCSSRSFTTGVSQTQFARRLLWTIGLTSSEFYFSLIFKRGLCFSIDFIDFTLIFKVWSTLRSSHVSSLGRDFRLIFQTCILQLTFAFQLIFKCGPCFSIDLQNWPVNLHCFLKLTPGFPIDFQNAYLAAPLIFQAWTMLFHRFSSADWTLILIFQAWTLIFHWFSKFGPWFPIDFQALALIFIDFQAWTLVSHGFSNAVLAFPLIFQAWTLIFHWFLRLDVRLNWFFKLGIWFCMKFASLDLDFPSISDQVSTKANQSSTNKCQCA